MAHPEPAPNTAPLDPEQITVDELLDKEQIQTMRDVFAESTGIEVVVAKPGEQGTFLAKPHIYRFCRELRKIPSFMDDCTRCYIGTKQNLDTKTDFNIAPCHIGFYTYGCSIRFNDRVIALMGGCMVAPKKNHISREELESICERYGYSGDRDALFPLLDDFPVLDESALKKQLAIFREMSRVISEVARKQFQHLEDRLQKERLSRYFSPSVYDLVSTGSASKPWKGRATVLFTDIRGFTAMSERLAPEQVVAMLNEYFELMVGIVFKNSGTLDKFIGDAMLAVFGAPIPSDCHEDQAVTTAREMIAALDNLNEQRAARGEPPIDIGIGIHTGDIVAGNVGSQQRTEFTVIGDTVNVASRLESATKLFKEKIIISDETWKGLTAGRTSNGKCRLKLKGKGAPLIAYRL
jgi:class 3 adenylate cyclase